MEAEDAEAAPSPQAASAPPIIFRGGEVTVNYFGVAKNDAYLTEVDRHRDWARPDQGRRGLLQVHSASSTRAARV